jgi:NADPH-dependent 2,4-dienoyl-CoA reductase/sulfur reductase-like enzyme
MSERLLVIGGDAGGMAAASQARRMQPDMDIVAFERGTRTSYAACGIPYHVAGMIEPLDRLVARKPEVFRERQNIDVQLRHDVVGIDPAAATITVHDLDAGSTRTESYDHLLVATGARPVVPPLPGIELAHTVHNLDDSAKLLELARQSNATEVVIIGGGYIGLEMAEAFLAWGAHVTVLDAAPQVMRTFDPALAALIRTSLEALGVDVRTDVSVEGIEPGAVLTADGKVAADLVVLGIGVVPNSELARDAGLDLGPRGAITVDDYLRTSAERVWSAGDCAASRHLVTGQPVHIALGTVANKAGRVAGTNIAGGDLVMPGVLGTAITRVNELELARTGLAEFELEGTEFADAVSATIEAQTRAHYFPGATPITVKLVADRASGRVIGGQIVGGPGAAKRIDTIATAVTAGLTAHQVVDLDLAYAPPFSPVWDPVATAARSLLKVLDRD